MRVLILLIIDSLAMLFFITSIAVFIGNYKQTVEGFPKLFRNKFFLAVTGFCLFMVILIFCMGVLEWEQPIRQYEQVIEPLYRLKR